MPISSMSDKILNDLSWEEKYHQADSQLQKFRSQAGKVRELLAKKLKEYEDKVDETDAEKETLKEKINQLENLVKDKDEAISALREKITVLRDERAKENEIWEERESIMKNWIKTKITELLHELERTKEEKKEFERKLILENEKAVDQQTNDDDDNIYSEIFEQILGDLKKPKYEPLWDHSRPTTPVTPGFQRKSFDNVTQDVGFKPSSPAIPQRMPLSNSRSVDDLLSRQTVLAPDEASDSKLLATGKSNGPELFQLSSSNAAKKRLSSNRFFERRFSDITAPQITTSTSPVLPRRRFSKPGPSTPPPVAKKPQGARRYSKPILLPRDKDKHSYDDVFFGDSNREKIGNDVADNVENDHSINKRVSDAEPKYFELEGTYCGIEYENENKAPVYATLRGVASQIREIPFSGESTDSEADLADTESVRGSPSAFKSYISNTENANSSLGSSNYDTPYDSIENTLGSEQANNLKKKDRNILKTCAPYTSQNMRTETLEKSGYLTKLGGRVKNWKKRWFLLHENKLSYYKSSNDTFRKPLGQIDLEKISSVSRSERPNTFEICTPARTYYLTAESEETVDGWLKVLRNNLKRCAGARLLSRAGDRTIHSGWVTKVKGGSSKHCWCVLREKTLLFYKSETEQNPSSAVNLSEIINVQSVENISGNLSGDDDGRCTLMIQCLQDAHPMYLVIASRREVEEWRRQITNLNREQQIAALVTDFENLVTKLMSVDGDAGSRFWQDALLVHTRALISHPLCTLSKSELNVQAVRMFKSISLYSTTPINEQAIDYHISLAQDILQLCFTHRELQNEIYCQLIKQTTKLRQKHGMRQIQTYLSRQSDWQVDHAGDQTIDLNPVPDFVYIQCWHLLSLCTSLFLPKLKILWLLQAHLTRNSSVSTNSGKYALYCTRSLERAFKAGEREARPSRPEVMSIILRNPYYLPLPMSTPVYFNNNTYQVFSFDGSTTVSEFCESINMEIGIRECSESGYALFSDNPIATVEHCLQSELKLCDVISKWEQALKCLRQGKVERQRTIKLIYKNRLYFKSLTKMETNKERYLLVYQVNENILAGYLQPAPETSYQLAALLAQIEFGGYSDNFKSLNEVVERFVPDYHKNLSKSVDNGMIKRKMYKSIADSWSNFQSKSINDCVQSYLGIVRSFPFFGSKMFEAKERITSGKKEEQKSVLIAVEEEKITILDLTSRVSLATYSYTSVVTFGGYRDDFMLVINDDTASRVDKTGRHLFVMSKGKVLEITFLIASYINAVVTRHGLNLELRKDKRRASTNPSDKNCNMQLWDMESFG